MSKRVKREGQNVMDWLNEVVASDPEAQKAFEDETLRLQLADALREMREEAGMTQTLVAEEMCVKQSFVSRLERSEHNHTIETVLSYLQAVGAGLVLAIVKSNGRDLIPASALAENAVLLPKEVARQAEAVEMSLREYVLSCVTRQEVTEEVTEAFCGELRQHMSELKGWMAFEQVKPNPAKPSASIAGFAEKARGFGYKAAA